MNRKIYNFASIEYHQFQGPGRVIGMVAADSEADVVPYIFVKAPELSDQFEDIVEQLGQLLNDGTNVDLNGKDLMRVITTPTQNKVRYVPRGVRYCELDQEDQMMEELLSRFTDVEQTKTRRLYALPQYK